MPSNSTHRPEPQELVRAGISMKPENFVLERRPLGGSAVGSKVPADWPEHKVKLMYEQCFIGLTEAAKSQFQVGISRAQQRYVQQMAASGAIPSQLQPKQSKKRK